MLITCLGVFGPYPASCGATSGYLVSSDKSLVLFDCGSGVISRLMQFASPEDLDAVVLSHWHYDHMSDLFVLGYLLQKSGKTLPLIAPTPPEHMKNLLEELPFELLNIENIDRIGDIKLSSSKTRHPVPCFATKFENKGRIFVYTGDAADESGLLPFCKDADLILCDAAFIYSERPENAPHMSALMAAELAKKTDKAKLVLTHFIPGEDLDALLLEAVKIYKNSHLAEENKRFEV
ncbi:MAG: MBL fold metallo-hydrolase [Eubacteriales bacterium]|nr:MBL fold metallo-hydrolase [Eubacteriales bacterium]